MINILGRVHTLFCVRMQSWTKFQTFEQANNVRHDTQRHINISAPTKLVVILISILKCLVNSKISYEKKRQHRVSIAFPILKNSMRGWISNHITVLYTWNWYSNSTQQQQQQKNVNNWNLHFTLTSSGSWSALDFAVELYWKLQSCN